MMGDGRLGQIERLCEVAHADLVRRRQAIDDRDPGRVRERFELRGQLVALVNCQRLRGRAAAEGGKDGD